MGAALAPILVVMRGLDPRIRGAARAVSAVDRRVKPGDDRPGLGGGVCTSSCKNIFSC